MKQDKVRIIEPHHIVPSSNYGLHVEIAWEEGNDSVWHNFAVFHENTAKVSNHGGIISNFKARADVDLITTTSYDLHYLLALNLSKS
jgi:alpha-ketoglutarate-dependent taurine dioxygenase